MEDSSISTIEPTSPPVKLRWYQYRLSTILWVTLVVALVASSVMMLNRIRTLEKQLETFKIVMPPAEVEQGWLSQVSEGPGMIFRGYLPEGKWRLAIYFWNGKVENSFTGDVPPNLAPLAAREIPNPNKVDIQIEHVSLPPNTSHSGTIATSLTTASIKETRPGKHPYSYWPTEPVFLAMQSSGCFSTNTKISPIAGEPVVLFRTGYQKEAGDQFIIRIEPMDGNSLPPQMGTDKQQ